MGLRRLIRIAVIGLAAALLVFLAGRLAEIFWLGRGRVAAQQRVADDVRSSFDRMADQLRRMAGSFGDAQTLLSASEGNVADARVLFEAAQAAVAEGSLDELAVTAYAADGRPVAWAGRPAELPQDRLQGGDHWFFAQGAPGLRLVHVVPVFAAGGRRVGTIAAERSLDSPAMAATPASSPESFQFNAGLVPVSLDLDDTVRPAADASTFEIHAPSGDHLADARMSFDDLARARVRWRRATLSLSLIVWAVSMLLLAGPILDWRKRAVRPGVYIRSTILIVAAIVAARGLFRLASPADWSDAPIFSAAAYASPLLGTLLASPFDFFVTALTAGGVVALGFYAVEAWRLTWKRRRRSMSTAAQAAMFIVMQVAAGAGVAALLVGHERLLRDTIANTTLDLLHFSLHPLDPGRLALQAALVVWHATTLGLGVMLLRAATVMWRVPRHNWRVRAATVVAWALPLLVWQLAAPIEVAQRLPVFVALGAGVALALAATRLKARYHRGSQAFRLTMLTLGLVIPSLAFYPSVFRLAWSAKSELVETRYAPQALNQRQAIQTLLQQSLSQIDRLPDLPALLAAAPVEAGAPSDRAFQVWRITALAAYPITSSVELYGPDGRLESRFAFNLPNDLAAPRSEEQTCDWQIFEGVSPFFAEERRVLHAGRNVCVSGRANGRRIAGSIAVNAILDYANLPFISSRNPYVELMRPSDPIREEGLSGGDVEYVVYGWSGAPLYASADTAWPLDAAVFARVADSRSPVWARLRRDDDEFDVYLMNDRGGIYALGFPTVSAFGHVMNLAELTVLAAGTYVLLLLLNVVFATFSRRGTSAPALLREVRASFYRKLFLAFVAAAVVPVIALAIVTRNYIAAQMRDSTEQEAVRTASAARRVVEDLAAPRAAAQGVGVDDNLMVWVSRLIDQDVNMFSGPRLLATSDRNVFASGLLPTRMPAPVYRALELENAASTVAREQIGNFEYLVAATPMTARFAATLTVPLTSRQREIDRERDTLDRRVLLGALLFILAGAGIGYSMAERIADPVNRLTRATRRIARGDLDARIAATSSDELRRLVEDFNSMARELQRQRTQLERTHRLEAWAEMARQVAHEIKNPLTPIQLNAEHLRRVHTDRGEPLGHVLEECVETILTQVTLLRQIASEFSSFASSPTARPMRVEVPELLERAIEPYRVGLSHRIRFEVDVPPTLPAIHVDRTLIARSLTNIVENALHAMPGAGTLRVAARADDHAVRIRVSDTGVGMDAESLARAFEPYFSTKSAGTGLGLPIAKRNVELNGGTITVSSERDRGTTVEVTLPVSHQEHEDVFSHKGHKGH